LMSIFNVSRITVRRAVRELVDMGLAESRRGMGTLVTSQVDRGRLYRQRGAIEDLLENLIVIGDRTRVEVVFFGLVPAPAEVARTLDVRAGQRIRRVIRVLHQGPKPLCLIDAFVTPEVAQLFSRKELENDFIATLLHRAGIQMAKAHQTLSARAATGSDATSLGIKAGSPLFNIALAVFDPKGRPLELVKITYPADKYQYRMSLVQSRRNWLRDPQSPGLASLRPGKRKPQPFYNLRS
jgi:GntR family transcriptional regulator